VIANRQAAFYGEDQSGGRRRDLAIGLLRTWWLSACPVQPLAAEQDFGGARREVLFDFGVVVGEDAFDVRLGFAAVVLGVAGGDEIEKWHVVAAAGFQRGLGCGRGELRFTGGEVVSRDEVGDIDDHPHKFVVEGWVAQPGIAVRSARLRVERNAGNQTQRLAQVVDPFGSTYYAS